jgi:transposase
MQKPIVGVDISKDWFDINVLVYSLKERFSNDLAGFKKFRRWLKKHKLDKYRICMEATGMHWEALAAFAHEEGQEVIVVNPSRISDFSKSKLRRAKTDKADAELIALFCEQNPDLHLWVPQSAAHREIKELLRRRGQFVDQLTATKNRIKAGYQSEYVYSSLKREIAWLLEEIKAIEKLAKAQAEADEELKELTALLVTIPGVGWLTAVTLLVEVPKPLWEGRLASAYAGLVPHIKDSGKCVGKKSYLSRVGSSRVRAAVHMPSLTAKSKNQVLKDFYERLIRRGKKPKQACTAVARKLVDLVFAIVRTKCPFQPDHRPRRMAATA